MLSRQFSKILRLQKQTTLRPLLARQQFTFSVENQTSGNKMEVIQDGPAAVGMPQTLREEIASRIINTAELVQQEKEAKDKLFHQETRKITDIRQLYSFSQTNKVSEMTLEHSLKVLQLINLYSPQYKDQPLKIQDALNATQFEIISRIKQDLMKLEPNDQVTFLNNVAYSNIGVKTKIERADLMEIEKQIVAEYEDYITTDVANLAASFIRMQVVPSFLIEKILSPDYFTILQSNGSYILLRQMIMTGVTGQQKLYQMLWDNMRTEQVGNLSLSKCIEYIQFVISYQKMIPASHEQNISNLQLLLDRFAGQAKSERYIDSYAHIMKAINQVKAYVRSTSEIPNNTVHHLETSEFFAEATKVVFRRLDKLNPGEMNDLLSSLDGDSDAKKALVSDILVSMRVDRYDIRTFNFSQLTQFIGLVAETHPGDLKIFVKYLDAAVLQRFYDDDAFNNNFDQYIDVMWRFGINGYVEESPKMIKFVQILTQKLRGDNKSIPHAVHKNLINLLWVLIQRETHLTDSANGSLAISQRNPLIPRLLTHLYNYKPRRKLTKMEYLQLFQINLWIQDKCGSQVYPEEFKNCIPAHQTEAADRHFEEYDQPRFREVQEDMARHLLQMRITFSENERMAGVYRGDIGFQRTNGVILIHRADTNSQVETQPGEIKGLEMMRKSWIAGATGIAVENINVYEWEQLTTDQKLIRLHDVYTGRAQDEEDGDDEEEEW